MALATGLACCRASTIGLHILNHPPLLLVFKGGFALITCLDLLAPLCLVHRGFRRVGLTILVPFHVVTWLTMDIFFWENLLPMVVLLFDIDTAVDGAYAWFAARRPSPRWALLRSVR